MTYAEFLVGIDDLIARGDLAPSWRKAVRTRVFKALLLRSGLLTRPAKAL